MNETYKLNCNIIRDLLPSYLEEVCSQDTKDIVDAHLSECSKCRMLKAALQETEFVSEQTDRSQINYAKKLRRHFINQVFFSTLILSSLILLGFTTFIKNYSISPNIYYVFLPVLLFYTRAVIPIPPLHERIERKQKILTAISTAVTCYIFFLAAVLLTRIPQITEQGTGPFHLKPEQAGPFLDIQIIIAALLQAVLYITGLFHTLYKKAASFPCMGIYLTYCFLLFRLRKYLADLSDIAFISQDLLIPVLVLLLEGISIVFLLSIAAKAKQKTI